MTQVSIFCVMHRLYNSVLDRLMLRSCSSFDSGHLFLACANGDLREMKRIIDVVPFLFVSRLESNGYTLLHQAAQCGHLHILKYLLTSGADIDIRTQDHNGCNPTVVAIAGGHTKAYEYLLGKRANPSGPAVSGWDVLRINWEDFWDLQVFRVGKGNNIYLPSVSSFACGVRSDIGVDGC